ncbi:MAG: hypothetical protein KC933_30660, partial [Myxococcales bacterium]|nr:hypothetical protein [Myxococcales bacterium]
PTPRETLPTPVEPAAAEPAPKQATLRVRIGNGWGNIRINGKLERSGVFDGAFKLAPGRHMVEVFRPDGRHRPRTVEVDDEGNLFEVGAGGARADLVGGELLFRMPSRGGTEPGWIPAESEATATPQPERGG